VRSEEYFAKGHVPTAENLPNWKINETSMSKYPADTLFVVYCAGPHCNGANKAALALAKLNRQVKEMIGGAIGWLDEGFELVMAGDE
ncbi:MAG: rhodanese-like domain-containing protein, partial [Planctomycetota bacterium]